MFKLEINFAISRYSVEHTKFLIRVAQTASKTDDCFPIHYFRESFTEILAMEPKSSVLYHVAIGLWVSHHG